MCGVRRIDRKVGEVVEITKETLDRSGLGFGIWENLCSNRRFLLYQQGDGGKAV